MEEDGTPIDDTLGRHLLARQLARQAGDLILSMRSARGAQPLTVHSKSSSSDLVTSADHASQQLIFSALSKAYPHHRLIGEEQDDATTNGLLDTQPTWIVDAIDGTTNYVHGLSDFCVSIAFACDRVVELGVVYNPCRQELFCGIRGRGATLNDVSISVSACDALRDAIILTEWGYVRSRDSAEAMLAVNEELLVGNCRGIRQIGSGALDMCYVAMGRAEGIYCGVAPNHEEAWEIWDYAAAAVIAEEAGAALRDVNGKKFEVDGDSMVCATPGMLDDLLKAIRATAGGVGAGSAMSRGRVE